MARTIVLHDDFVAQMSRVLNQSLDEPRDIVMAIMQLTKIAEDTKCGKELRVNTPDGDIVAAVIEDEAYPGINLNYNEYGRGEPGAIMDYSEESGINLYVWDKDGVEYDPVIYQMN